ncbi:MAG: hypothetical protein B9S32_06190 [Verrucomicrobia bacterium Tous-C9LFEB]|nr:MAG: hypothetical protein B9S32_06190 [Verrucomicrobia bacterium Tous-C9LFEB]
MKRSVQFLFLVLIALALGAAAFAVCRYAMTTSTTGQPELEWLRAEYQLDDAQYTRVVALHQNYQPVCDALCAKIAAKNAEIDQLIRTSPNGITPALAQAFREEGELRSACRLSMLNHIYAVSREMSPAQGKRYLDMMATQITCPASEMPRTHSGHHSDK